MLLWWVVTDEDVMLGMREIVHAILEEYTLPLAPDYSGSRFFSAFNSGPTLRRL